MHLIATPIRCDSPVHHRGYLGWLMVVAMFATPAIAQQVAFPSGAGVPVQSGVSSGSVNIPQTNLTPVAPPPTTYAPPTSGVGQFDPYKIGPNSVPGIAPSPSIVPSLSGPGVAIGPPSAAAPVTPYAIAPSPPGGSIFSRIFSQPAGYGPPAPSTGLNAPIYGSPAAGPYNNPNVYGPQSTYAPPPGSTYPSTIYPSSTPSTLFPNGVLAGDMFASTGPVYGAYRMMQGPRFQYTFVSGGSKPTGLQINDFDTSLVFAFPNFLYSTQPVYVIPSFSLHLWDGPVGTTGADLPANAYSAFLDTGWKSDPNQMVGTEFGLRVGVFSDFNTSNSDSVRVLGRALVNFRMSPTSTIKGGVYYLDRNSVKLIPAFGFICQPNPFTRWDIYFPKPRYSRYCRTVGTRDVWWYVTGDYGGGSWTIKRTDGTEDSVDINDLQVVLGLEWGNSEALRIGRRTAFAEIGYVFSRELKYRYNPLDDIKPEDGFMFSLGFGY